MPLASSNPLAALLYGLAHLLDNALQVPVLVLQTLLFALDGQLVQQSLVGVFVSRGYCFVRFSQEHLHLRNTVGPARYSMAKRDMHEDVLQRLLSLGR